MFERGFKSWSENVAISVRNELSLQSTDPLPPDRLADHLGIHLWTPRDLEIDAQDLATLVEEEQDGWSAFTVSWVGRSAIVFNSAHSRRRQSSDIMHELSHVVIGHEPARVALVLDQPLVLRTFDRKQEEEAAWLAGCLLLPRPALLAITDSGRSESAACLKYMVSEDLLTYRLNVTGVMLQISRRKSSKKRGTRRTSSR